MEYRLDGGQVLSPNDQRPPGDTTKDYKGLHWMPSAKAIIAGDESLRSTLFIADKSEDKGPILLQSKPLDIIRTLGNGNRREKKG